MHELRDITFLESGPECRVNTIHNDVWTAELEDAEFEYYYSDRAQRLDLYEDSVERVSFSPIGQSPWKPQGQGRVFFGDGNAVFIDVGDLTLDVENGLGKWKLPVGSVKQLRVVRLRGEDEAVDVLARFPSGRTKRFHCAGPMGRGRVTDTFGNRTRMLCEDASSISGREGLGREQTNKAGVREAGEEGPDPQAGVDELQVLVLVSKDGRTRATCIPTLIWTLRGALGPVLLPAATLREINSEPKVSGQCAITVYGEHFFGKIAPRALSVPGADHQGEDVRLDVLNQRRIGFDTPELPVPDGLWLFRMHSGDAFYGRFLQESLGFVTADRQRQPTNILSRSVVIIHTADSHGVRSVITHDDVLRSLRPASRKVELSLLINGMKHTVHWSSVRSVTLGSAEISRPTEPVGIPEERGKGLFARLGTVPGAGQEESDEAVSADDETVVARTAQPGRERTTVMVNSRHQGDVEVKTSMGTIELPYALTREIYSASEASVSCFVTVYGDSFVGRRCSRSQLAALSGREDPGSRSVGIPPVLSLNNQRREPPSGWLAWRLTSGDVFYARLAKKRIKVSAAKGASTEISAGNVLAVTPSPNKELALSTPTGVVMGRMESGEVPLTLFCTSDSLAVPSGLIECARVGTLADLPPPVAVVPGTTPLQEGVALTKGGSFLMGRKAERDGMPDEIPRREVTVSPFYIDACEVTRDQFARFVDETGHYTEAEKSGEMRTWRNPGFQQEGDEPAVCVSWYDAIEYCNWRSREARLDSCYEIGGADQEVVCHHEKSGYRLPTEAEWEFAARSWGEDVVFPWMDDPEAGTTSGSGEAALTAVLKANFAQAETERQDNWLWTNPVKAFDPNKADLYGMGGNVWEWCQDLYFDKAYYAVHKRGTRDPSVEDGAFSGLTRRVMRGGSFENELDMLRCASRGSGAPHASANRVGFRCVRRRVPNAR